MSQAAVNWTEFYQEQLCSHSDSSFRFAIALVLERKTAVQLVQQAFAKLATRQDLTQSPDLEHEVICETWKRFQALKKKPDKRMKGGLINFLAPLTPIQRAGMVAVDFLGMKLEKVSEIMQVSSDNLSEELIAARKALVHHSEKI